MNDKIIDWGDDDYNVFKMFDNSNVFHIYIMFWDILFCKGGLLVRHGRVLSEPTSPFPPITLSYGPKLASLPLLTGGGIKFSWFLVVETIDLTEETTSTSWMKHKLIRC